MKILEKLVGPQQTRTFGLVALGSLLMVFAACQLVAGVQSRTLDPIAYGTCSLPTGTGPSVRFANFAPTSQAVDVCIRATGTSWQEPLILNGGTGCTQAPAEGAATPFPTGGFAYTNITVAFPAPGSTVDVKTVAAGGTCNSPPLSEADGIALQGGTTVTTLMHIGGAAGQGLKLVALPEWDSAGSSNGGLFRYVNASPSVPQLDFGVMTNAIGNHQLPGQLTTVFNQGSPVPFGATLPKNATVFGAPVVDNGYAKIPEAAYDLGGAVHGPNNNAIFLFSQYHVGNLDASIYVVGVQGSAAFPLEAFLCPEPAPGTMVPPNTSNPLLLACSLSNLPTIGFDVFNPALYGQNSPDFSARELVLTGQDPNVPDPIAKRTADVMCLVEVDSAADQAALIAEAAKAGLTYSYTISTQLGTPFSNGGKTQDGGTCPTTIMPPCAGVAPSDIDAALSCLEMNCANQPNDQGVLDTSTDCFSAQCSGPLAPLFVGQQACFDCLTDYIASGTTYGFAKQTCNTNPNPPLGSVGANSTIIVSKYPLAKTDKYILPSTNYRRSILYAQVQFPENLNVDFYCSFFITPLIAAVAPYEGCFGNGYDVSHSQLAYEQENLFEAKLAAAWVQQKSGKNRAVILGDFRAGPGSKGGKTGAYPPPQPLAQDTYTFLTTPVSQGGAGWHPAQGPNWPAAGQCSYCPGSVNPLNGTDTSQFFLEQPYLYNWPEGDNAVTDEKLIYTENVLTFGDAGTPNAPVSPYYGLNIQLQRPAQ